MSGSDSDYEDSDAFERTPDLETFGIRVGARVWRGVKTDGTPAASVVQNKTSAYGSQCFRICASRGGGLEVSDRVGPWTYVEASLQEGWIGFEVTGVAKSGKACFAKPIYGTPEDLTRERAVFHANYRKPDREHGGC